MSTSAKFNKNTFFTEQQETKWKRDSDMWHYAPQPSPFTFQPPKKVLWAAMIVSGLVIVGLSFKTQRLS